MSHVLGQRLKSARQTVQLSQAVLGKMAGISQPFVAQIERGDRVPSQQVVNALANALNLPVDTLLGNVATGVDQAETVPFCERQHDELVPVPSRFASPGLIALMEDHELLAFLKIRPDEWMTLSSIQTLWPLKKDGYVQLLMTLRAVSHAQDRAA